MNIYEGTEKYIFVSYAHADSDRVMPILEALDREGFRLWYDSGIEVGSEWPAYIEEHIKSCHRMIFFVSKSSVNSKNCRREVNLADSLNIEMVVAYLENVELKNGLNLQISSNQAIYREKHSSEDSFIDAIMRAKLLLPCKVERANAVEEKVEELIEDIKPAIEEIPQDDVIDVQEEIIPEPIEKRSTKSIFSLFRKDEDPECNSEELSEEEQEDRYLDAISMMKSIAAQNDLNEWSLKNSWLYGGWETHRIRALLYDLAKRGHTKSQYVLGIVYKLGEELSSAVDNFRRAAENDHPYACYELGKCYLYGEGTDKNPDKAIEYLLQAKGLGVVEAAVLLGDYFHAQREYGEADYNYQYASDRGNITAMVCLGDYYLNGWGGFSDTAKAINLYKKAEKLDGHIVKEGFYIEEYLIDSELSGWKKEYDYEGLAASRLGDCYYEGTGVEQSYSLAVYWYSKRPRDARSMFRLAECYAKLKDSKNAQKWYKQAAYAGLADAQYKYGVVLQSGALLHRNRKDAFKMYRFAAEQGHAEAQSALADCYLRGIGVKKNIIEAVYWLRCSADQGYQPAIDKLDGLKKRGVI